MLVNANVMAPVGPGEGGAGRGEEPEMEHLTGVV